MITSEEIRSIVTRYATEGGGCFTHADSLIDDLNRANNRTMEERVRDIVQMYPAQKIQGIKEIRLRFSLGLKEAKDAYEAAYVNYLEDQLIEELERVRGARLAKLQFANNYVPF